MTYKELMTESLSALLEDGEKLLHPVYGTFKQKNNNWFGFFGLTEHYLLIALLKGSSKEMSWTTRVPLDIKKVTVKKGIFSLIYNIYVEFFEGEAGHFQVSKKVHGFESQEKNVKGFIDYIQTRQIPIC